MSEKKGRAAPRSEPATAGEALKEKRDAFLHTFFKRGAELSDELVHDNQVLREQLTRLEAENTELRTQLASDRAIRDLLTKIEALERDKERLLSTVQETEEITGRISNRFSEIESELESFANLYVASFQLHLTLGVSAVVSHVKELLEQLVGARSLSVYFVDVEGKRLEPVAAAGVTLAEVPAIPLDGGNPGGEVEVLVERALLTGIAYVADVENPRRPAACIPLTLGDRTAGVIVVYELLVQKRRLATVDRELFKLLGAHAAPAIVGAYYFGKSGDRIPTPSELRAITS